MEMWSSLIEEIFIHSEIVENFWVYIIRFLRPDIFPFEKSILKGLIIRFLKLQILHIFFDPNFNPIFANHNNCIKIFIITKIYKK